ncbi:hypothetical protein [Nonomuraea sp. NPDC049400]|uniref:hypothetical protein n=1 Tax=Nonomuraea sp. NPDC049400 TaxID=3364352 RepID=UPI0037BB62A5
MGKFDGMDPKLVRDLLTEVKHAATQMRAVEDRVRLAMSRAGVSTVTTHRPAQVADAADAMVKDVNVRLGVLEKRVDQPRGDVPEAGAGSTQDDEPKDVRGDQDKYDNPRAAETPPKNDDTRTDADGKTGDGAKTDADGKTGDEARTDADGKTGDEARTDADGKTGDEARTDADGKTGDEARTDADGKTGDEARTDADGKTDADGDGKTCDDAKDTGNGQDTGTDGRAGDQPVDQPKDDDLDSRRDRGAEADGGTTGTPAKDRQDVSKPQIVEVDGVKVLQIPIDPPTAEQLEDLLENADKVQPADMPKLPADTATTHAADVNAWANDGSDVVSADTTPPDLDALKTVVDRHREIPPLDMPGLSETSGYDTTPGDGTAPTGGTNDDACASSKDTTPGGTDTTPGGTDTRPGGTDTTPGGTDTRPGGTDTTPGGMDTRPGGTDTTPGRADTTPGGVDVTPDRPSGGDAGQGAGDGQDAGGRGAGDQGDGGTGDQRAGGQGAPVTIPPTNPSVQVQIAYGPESGASNVNAWASDGSDVVSVDVAPPSLDALRTVVEHHRDIQPLDMPSVEVPPGEYGKGEWAPRDIRPDGPQGEIDPGTPERSA